MIIDTHAHYDDEAFNEDRDKLLSSLSAQGVSIVINSGADQKGCLDTLSLSEKYPFVYGSLGIHPSETKDLTEEYIKWLTTQIKTSPKIVAVGEIGLDYYGKVPDREIQQFWFRRQLEMAKELGLPVVIHSREAAEDTMSIIKEYADDKLKGSIHCYSYSKEMANEYVKLGFCIGVGGVVTFKNARRLVETVEAVPIERILLETDSPYLSPEPHRGTRNDSTNLKFVAEKIAQIKQISVEEVIKVTQNNAEQMFGI